MSCLSESSIIIKRQIHFMYKNIPQLQPVSITYLLFGSWRGNCARYLSASQNYMGRNLVSCSVPLPYMYSLYRAVKYMKNSVYFNNLMIWEWNKEIGESQNCKTKYLEIPKRDWCLLFWRKSFKNYGKNMIWWFSWGDVAKTINKV